METENVSSTALELPFTELKLVLRVSGLKRLKRDSTRNLVVPARYQYPLSHSCSLPQATIGWSWL